jgi:hypothetical protein
MEKSCFEEVLSSVCDELTSELRTGVLVTKSSDFESIVRNLLSKKLVGTDLSVDFDPHPHVFPDICLPPYGVEVKFTVNDTWRSVANSIFETTRNQAVSDTYVIFGKQGGVPEVKWGEYGKIIVHVRTSHVPRFEVDLTSNNSLFEKMGITYQCFSELTINERMEHIRSYARGRLKEGERLWWIEQPDESRYTLPLEVRLYMSLDQLQKRKLRAEAALLCPTIVASGRTRGKYDDAVLYLLTTHGVLCSQARDLFSAGSVALRGNEIRGGNYVQRALLDIEEEMIEAALYLDEDVYTEYWGSPVPPKDRIPAWLERADALASTWVPSDVLFKDVSR